MEIVRSLPRWRSLSSSLVVREFRFQELKHGQLKYER